VVLVAAMTSQKEVTNIAGMKAVVQKIKRPMWPAAGWMVFYGNLEATGLTREDAIYNFERLLEKLQ
jgi:hypothetical protein